MPSSRGTHSAGSGSPRATTPARPNTGSAPSLMDPSADTFTVGAGRGVRVSIAAAVAAGVGQAAQAVADVTPNATKQAPPRLIDVDCQQALSSSVQHTKSICRLLIDTKYAIPKELAELENTVAAGPWREEVLKSCRSFHVASMKTHSMPPGTFSQFELCEDRGPSAIDTPIPRRTVRDADPRDDYPDVDIFTPPGGGFPNVMPEAPAQSHEDYRWAERFFKASGSVPRERLPNLERVYTEFTEEVTRMAIIIIRKFALCDLGTSGAAVVTARYASGAPCTAHGPRTVVRGDGRLEDPDDTDGGRLRSPSMRSRSQSVMSHAESDAGGPTSPDAAKRRRSRANRRASSRRASSIALSQSTITPLAEAPHQNRAIMDNTVARDDNEQSAPRTDRFMVDGVTYEIMNTRQRIDLVRSHEACMQVGKHKLQGVSAITSANVPLLNQPLCALVEYAGYRVWAVAHAPTAPTTLVYGSDRAGGSQDLDPYCRHDAQAIACMKQLAETLNIRGHYCGVGATRQFLHCNADLSVHRGRDNRLYITSGQDRLIPPVTTLQTHYPNGYLYRRLRPELVKLSRKSRQSLMPISSDVFSNFGLVRFEEYDREAALLTELYRRQIVPDAAEKLLAFTQAATSLGDAFDRLYLEGGVSALLHRYGVNVRSIGDMVTRLSERFFKVRAKKAGADPADMAKPLAYLITILRTEMIARAVKTIVRRLMRNRSWNDIALIVTAAVRVWPDTVAHDQVQAQITAGQTAVDDLALSGGLTPVVVPPLATPDLMAVPSQDDLTRTPRSVRRDSARAGSSRGRRPVTPGRSVGDPSPRRRKSRTPSLGDVSDSNDGSRPVSRGLKPAPKRRRGRRNTVMSQMTVTSQEEVKDPHHGPSHTWHDFFELFVWPVIDAKFGAGEGFALAAFTPATISLMSELNGKTINTEWVVEHIMTRTGCTFVTGSSDSTKSRPTEAALLSVAQLSSGVITGPGGGVGTPSPFSSPPRRQSTPQSQSQPSSPPFSSPLGKAADPLGHADGGFGNMPLLSVTDVAFLIDQANTDAPDEPVHALPFLANEPRPVVKLPPMPMPLYETTETQHSMGVARAYVRSIGEAASRGYLGAAAAPVYQVADQCAALCLRLGLTNDEEVTKWVELRKTNMDALESDERFHSQFGSRQRVAHLVQLMSSYKATSPFAQSTVQATLSASMLLHGDGSDPTGFGGSQDDLSIPGIIDFPQNRTRQRLELRSLESDTALFDYKSGQKLKLTTGPSEGRVVQVLGVSDAALWVVDMDPTDGSFSWNVQPVPGAWALLGSDAASVRERQAPVFFKGDRAEYNVPVAPPEVFKARDRHTSALFKRLSISTISASEALATEQINSARGKSRDASALPKKRGGRNQSPQRSQSPNAQHGGADDTFEVEYDDDDDDDDEVGPDGVLKQSGAVTWYFGQRWHIRRFKVDEGLAHVQASLKAGHRLLLENGRTTIVIGARKGRVWVQDEGIDALPRVLSDAELATTTVMHRSAVMAYNESPIEHRTGTYSRSAPTMMRFGVLSGHKIVFTRGPLIGLVCYVVGVRDDALHVANARSRRLCAVQCKNRKDLFAEHMPLLIGAVSDIDGLLKDADGAGAIRNHMYRGVHEAPIPLDCRASTLLPNYGVIHGAGVRITLGESAELAGVVLGAAFGHLWVQLDGTTKGVLGAVPVSRDGFVVLPRPLYPMIELSVRKVSNEAGADTAERNGSENFAGTQPSMETSAPPSQTLLFLSKFGVPLPFDIRDDVCGAFGLFSGQRVQLARGLFDEWQRYTVVGVYRDELWVVEDGEAAAVPLLGSTPTEIAQRYTVCDIVGHRSLRPFTDFLRIEGSEIAPYSAAIRDRDAKQRVTIISDRFELFGVNAEPSMFDENLPIPEFDGAPTQSAPPTLRKGDVLDLVRGVRTYPSKGPHGREVWKRRQDITTVTLLGWDNESLYIMPHGAPTARVATDEELKLIVVSKVVKRVDVPNATFQQLQRVRADNREAVRKLQIAPNGQRLVLAPVGVADPAGLDSPRTKRRPPLGKLPALPPPNMPVLSREQVDGKLAFVTEPALRTVDDGVADFPFAIRRMALLWVVGWFGIKLKFTDTVDDAKRLLASILQYFLPGGCASVEDRLTLEQTTAFRFPTPEEFVEYRSRLRTHADDALNVSQEQLSRMRSAAASTAVESLRAAGEPQPLMMLGARPEDGGDAVQLTRLMLGVPRDDRNDPVPPRIGALPSFIKTDLDGVSLDGEGGVGSPIPMIKHVGKGEPGGHAAAALKEMRRQRMLRRRALLEGKLPDSENFFEGSGGGGSARATSPRGLTTPKRERSLHRAKLAASSMSGMTPMEYSGDDKDEAMVDQAVLSAWVSFAQSRDAVRIAQERQDTLVSDENTNTQSKVLSTISPRRAESRAAIALTDHRRARASIIGTLPPLRRMSIVEKRHASVVAAVSGVAVSSPRGGVRQVADLATAATVNAREVDPVQYPYLYMRACGETVRFTDLDDRCADVFGFRRGDRCTYTSGDLDGVTVTILGVDPIGRLWRYEEAPPTGTIVDDRAWPFAATTREVLLRNHPIEVDSSNNTVREADLFWYPSTAGTSLTQFDMHDSALRRFGVVHGCRYLCRKPPSSVQAPPGGEPIVMAAIGVENGNVFFACDRGGAFTDAGNDPVTQMGLEPLYRATVQSFGADGGMVERVVRCASQDDRAHCYDATPQLLSQWGKHVFYGAVVMTPASLAAANTGLGQRGNYTGKGNPFAAFHRRLGGGRAAAIAVATMEETVRNNIPAPSAVVMGVRAGALHLLPLAGGDIFAQPTAEGEVIEEFTPPPLVDETTEDGKIIATVLAARPSASDALQRCLRPIATARVTKGHLSVGVAAAVAAKAAQARRLTGRRGSSKAASVIGRPGGDAKPRLSIPNAKGTPPPQVPEAQRGAETPVRALNVLRQTCLFNHSSHALSLYGVECGDVLQYTVGKLEQRVHWCIVLGVRDERLWKYECRPIVFKNPQVAAADMGLPLALVGASARATSALSLPPRRDQTHSASATKDGHGSADVAAVKTSPFVSNLRLPSVGSNGAASTAPSADAGRSRSAAKHRSVALSGTSRLSQHSGVASGAQSDGGIDDDGPADPRHRLSSTALPGFVPGDAYDSANTLLSALRKTRRVSLSQGAMPVPGHKQDEEFDLDETAPGVTQVGSVAEAPRCVLVAGQHMAVDDHATYFAHSRDHQELVAETGFTVVERGQVLRVFTG